MADPRPEDEDDGLPPESPKSDPVPLEHQAETDPDAETQSGVEAND
jgi:hypothetical protein